VAFDRKSPPFANLREGWGTLKFIRESRLERSKGTVRSDCGTSGRARPIQAAKVLK